MNYNVKKVSMVVPDTINKREKYLEKLADEKFSKKSAFLMQISVISESYSKKLKSDQESTISR